MSLTEEKIIEVLKACPQEDHTQDGWIWRQRIAWARAIESALREEQAAEIARLINWPADWDVMAYPTPQDALKETAAWLLHDKMFVVFKEELSRLREANAELEAQLSTTEKERNAFQDQCIALKIKHAAQDPVVDAGRSEAYYLIDRQLRNTLDDSEYADYSAALDMIYLAPVDFEPDAKRLAMELECLLLSCNDNAAVSKWWDSAHEALEQHRAMIAAAQEEA